jgi:hypothetical protein
MIINSKNLFKLFTKNLPKCEDCVYFYKKNDNGNCKKFGDIIYARSIDKNCSVDAKYFLKKNEFLK